MSTDVLGKPQDRLEGPLKVTGALRYSGDQPIEKTEECLSSGCSRWAATHARHSRRRSLVE